MSGSDEVRSYLRGQRLIILQRVGYDMDAALSLARQRAHEQFKHRNDISQYDIDAAVDRGFRYDILEDVRRYGYSATPTGSQDSSTGAPARREPSPELIQKARATGGRRVIMSRADRERYGIPLMGEQAGPAAQVPAQTEQPEKDHTNAIVAVITIVLATVTISLVLELLEGPDQPLHFIADATLGFLGAIFNTILGFLASIPVG